MNTPSHDEVAQCAYHYWQKAGSPHGRHDEFWLEAERQLKSEHEKHHAAPADPQVTASKAAIQKHDAWAPQVAHHTGPNVKPPETGKPIWSRPHGS